MNRFLLLIVLLFISLPPLCPAVSDAREADESIKASGYIRSFATYSVNPLAATESAVLETRLRLKLSGELSGRIHTELAYELAPLWRENTPSPPASSPYQGFSYRAGDLKDTLYPDEPDSFETFEVRQNLDRAFISYRARLFDLHVGRQPVAFGSARSVNPTDVLAPFPFNTIAKEERVGVDALRLKVPLGSMSELDMGAIFGDDLQKEKSAAYMRLKGYSLGTDFSVMAMRFREHSLYGLDMARAIGGAGTWLEAAHVFTNTPGEDYFSLSAGAEYMFTDELYAFLEYHRNGAGAKEGTEYIFNAFKKAYTDGGVYLMARNYLAPGISYQPTPLVGVSLSVIYNTDDRSALISPSMEYNAADDLYIGLGGFAGTGTRGSLTAGGSEFGSYPDLWYVSMSYYF